MSTNKTYTDYYNGASDFTSPCVRTVTIETKTYSNECININMTTIRNF